MLRDKSAIDELAYQLAVNHYNISLARPNFTESIQDNEKSLPGFEEIFNSKIEHTGFSRNILFIGAGASKSSFDFYATSNEIMEHLCFEELQLDKALHASTAIWQKFTDDASILLDHKITSETYKRDELLYIINTLNFEKTLKLLSNYSTPENLATALKKSILGKGIDHSLIDHNRSSVQVTDCLPSLFYEIVAHLFKHRFIDVIINMNFDEMLDNSLEDEMCDSTYYKIINDSDCKNIEEIIDDNRLSAPIYIKPHGTIRSSSSMKFTTEGYISHSKKLINLLESLISGGLTREDNAKKESGNNIEFINIMFAGYSFSDLDMKDVVYKNIIKKFDGPHKNGDIDEVAKLNYYFFGVNEKIVDKFTSDFSRWVQNKYSRRYRDVVLQIGRQVHFVKSDCLTKTGDDVSDLGVIFRELFYKIRSFYDNNLFELKDINSHILLCDMFCKSQIEEHIKNKIILKSPGRFFHKLAIFHCLYQFLKHKGKIPIDDVIDNHAGKYHMLHFDIAKSGDSEVKYAYQSNLIDCLEQILSPIENAQIEVESSYIICDAFYEATPDSKTFNEIVDLVVFQMMLHSYPNYRYHENQQVLKDEIVKLINKPSKMINLKYRDPNHGRFYPFKKECVIKTHLEFQWRFYSFLKEDNWVKLCIIDDYLRPAYNLEMLVKPNILSTIGESNKKIFLLQSENFLVDFNSVEQNPIRPVYDIMKSALSDDFQREFVPIKHDSSIHKMTLFLDKQNSPLYGIYFFKPSNKTAINPVFFDYRKDDHNGFTQKNLDNMRKLFVNFIPKDWNDLLALPIASAIG